MKIGFIIGMLLLSFNLKAGTWIDVDPRTSLEVLDRQINAGHEVELYAKGEFTKEPGACPTQNLAIYEDRGAVCFFSYRTPLSAESFKPGEKLATAAGLIYLDHSPYKPEVHPCGQVGTSGRFYAYQDVAKRQAFAVRERVPYTDFYDYSIDCYYSDFHYRQAVKVEHLLKATKGAVSFRYKSSTDSQ